jgi:hypothetical protein
MTAERHGGAAISWIQGLVTKSTALLSVSIVDGVRTSVTSVPGAVGNATTPVYVPLPQFTTSSMVLDGSTTTI